MVAATGSPPFHPTAPLQASRAVRYAALGYLFFVVYGSLVPLDFQYHSLNEALAQFAHIPYLSLGPAERADWVANVVLYVPLAYLVSASLASDADSGVVRGLKAAWVFVFCAAVAVGVEFTQIFFPPRTVSLNDIIAELIGSAIGVAIWHAAGDRLRGLWNEAKAGGPFAVRAALTLYLVAYLGVSFFPYDFLLSWHELSAKLATHRDSWLVSVAACPSAVRCAAQLGYETLAVIPLGVLVGILLTRGRPRRLRVALAYGALLGILVEVVQLFLESGVAQGISVLTRSVGAGLGLLLYDRLTVEGLRRFRPLMRPAVLTAIPLYLAALSVLEGWYARPWLPANAALARLPALHFLPFYYHYYTSEAAALASLLRNATLYAPLGLAVWGWRLAGPFGLTGAGTFASGLLGAVVALGFESSKLFLRAQHPDPTNVLIAFASAALAYAAAAWLTRWGTGTLPAAKPALRAPALPAPVGRRLFGARPLALLIIAATAWATASYPLGSAWLALALLAYGLLLFKYPSAWLFVVPALLPTLDLAPWSGWIYLGAFDLFIFVTVAVGLWNARADTRPVLLGTGAKWLVAAVAASMLVSTLIGLFPLQPLDFNAFSSYLSHYNALRVSKGFFEALALFAVLALQRNRPDPEAALGRLFLPGVAVGLLGVIVAIVWERLAFAGLLNFTSHYRAIGMFSSMQVGGSYVEAYLVFVLPLVVLWAILVRRPAVLLVAGVAVIGGTYCLLVTFARGGYLGLGVALLVLALGAISSWRAPDARRSRPRLGARLAVVALVLGVVALGAAAAGVPYAEYRFAKSWPDLGIRITHWRRSLTMINRSWLAFAFGMGVGRYPETYLLKNVHGRLPANYGFAASDGRTFLRLGASDSLYLGQLVPVLPRQRYLLSVDVHSEHGPATIQAHLCEKHILNSRDCRTIAIAAEGGKWTPRLDPVGSGDLGRRIGLLPPTPVELSFSNGAAPSVVDITHVRLLDPSGRNLVANGSFAAGAARWFFTTDDYLPFHAENLWVQVLFDQGWVGLLAFTLITGYLGIVLVRRSLRGHGLDTCLLTAFAGILTVGLFGSLLDAPRIGLIFYFTLLVALWHVSVAQARVGVGTPVSPVGPFRRV